MEAPKVVFLQPAAVQAVLADPQRRPAVVVLDVRDEDFAGGHIRGCCNVPSYAFQSGAEIDAFIAEHLNDDINTVIVHCYLSQQRGPMCARRLAERLSQVERQGKPEVCVLAHGWRRFKQLYGHTDLCEFDD